MTQKYRVISGTLLRRCLAEGGAPAGCAIPVVVLPVNAWPIGVASMPFQRDT
jgi:hypothetical protein